MSRLAAKTLVLTIPLPLTQHPAAVYLDGLADGSRPTMQHALFGDRPTLDEQSVRCDDTELGSAAVSEYCGYPHGTDETIRPGDDE